jgi:hypothetical protein
MPVCPYSKPNVAEHWEPNVINWLWRRKVSLKKTFLATLALINPTEQLVVAIQSAWRQPEDADAGLKIVG